MDYNENVELGEKETPDPKYPPTAMTTPLDDIAFLANSEHRVAVLDALETDPQTQQDLLERVDSSRVTLGRILRDLEARYWVERRGETYALTPSGEWVYEEVTGVLDVLETERQVREVIPWFPTGVVGFDVQWLRNAEVVRSTESDPTAPIRRTTVQLRDGTHVRILTMQVVASFFDIVEKPLVRGEMTLEAVATPEVYEAIGDDPRMATAFREVADAPGADFFVVEDVPLVLHIVDDSVLVGLVDDTATLRATIDSSAETIRSWAADYFESCVECAGPVSPEEIAV